jgi:hypothetical protein
MGVAIPEQPVVNKPLVVLEITTVALGLAPDLLWFVNEWCKEHSWTNPRVRSDEASGRMTVTALPPVSKDAQGLEQMHVAVGS